MNAEASALNHHGQCLRFGIALGLGGPLFKIVRNWPRRSTSCTQGQGPGSHLNDDSWPLRTLHLHTDRQSLWAGLAEVKVLMMVTTTSTSTSTTSATNASAATVAATALTTTSPAAADYHQNHWRHYYHD